MAPCSKFGLVVQVGTLTRAAIVSTALWLACSTPAQLTSVKAAVAAPPNALFQVVQACKEALLLFGNPFPCLKVHLGEDPDPSFAVVPNPGTRSVLLVPIKRITGIESPELLRTDSPNWWRYAWMARNFITQGTSRPIRRDDIALAINSREARSQDQLHIHVACVAPKILSRIRPFERAITHSWSPFPISLGSESWWAIRIEEKDLETNLFPLLHRLAASSKGLMQDWGMAAIAWTFAKGSDGFLVFATRHTDAFPDSGSGTSLVDPMCPSARS